MEWSDRARDFFGRGSQGTSALGRNVVSGDDTYFDTQFSRRRSERWEETFFFKHAGTIAFFGIWIVGWLLLTMITMMGYQAYGAMGGGQAAYESMGITFRGSVNFSLFIHALTRPLNILLPPIAGGAGSFLLVRYNRRVKTLNTDEDIIDYEGDASVLTIPELVAKYKAVPDRGAHFTGVDVTGIVSHISISNRGIKKQKIPVLVGENGEKPEDASRVVHEYVRDKNGNDVIRNGQKVIKTKMQPLMDADDGIQQLKNIGMTDKRFHILHDPTKLICHGKSGQTLAEYINEHWYIPPYETQRPSGVYLVDDSPVNVMIVAMTRGNKGQSLINPTLDLWTRQEQDVNIFVNDPKGELYTAFYASLKLRGFETVVFNLLDPMFTDQYNPLAPAITYLRKGYSDEPQKVLTQLADNFFPMPQNSEPIWTNGERMVFTMLCLLLIDVYYEEEQEYLDMYGSIYDPAQVARDLDEMWGHVTLPNVYRMVSVFATRKYTKKSLLGKELVDEETGEKVGETDQNMLEALFDLTMELPPSIIRNLFSGPYSNLQSMADSEKMKSSIYGMTLTEMAFFVEGPVIALTNASPKRSFDLISMSFPRRFEFKFNADYANEMGFVSHAVHFELYRDPYFKDKYEGEEFEHHTRIDKLSWVEMRFGGILEEPRTYVKMTLRPRGSTGQMVYGTFYAEFTKGYLKTHDGSEFVKDPITNEYQIRDGVLRPGVLHPQTGKFIERPPVGILPSTGKEVNVFDLTEVAYQEKPLAVFSVTPPSALVYVKIILMIIHSMFNTTVENSYMSKDDGKPLLKTKYMLDEAGNLSYQGSGIDALQTKLSIGLAQGQEYTLVFQTLQQITDIYGDTADRIISSNTGLMAFLLSNDLDMLETLSKQAGTRHVGRMTSKSMTKSVGDVTELIDDKVSYTMTSSEEPLFSVTRLLQMVNGEALILSTTKRTNNDGSNARQNPIFNTQDSSLPMAWSLHRHGYMQRSYSMLTVPTLNSTVGAADAIPPFEKILYKRAAQAALAPAIIEGYKKDRGLTDMEYDVLDPMEVGPIIMSRINNVYRSLVQEGKAESADVERMVTGISEAEKAEQERMKSGDSSVGETDMTNRGEYAEGYGPGGKQAQMKEETQADLERVYEHFDNQSLTEIVNAQTGLNMDMDSAGGVQIDDVVLEDKDVTQSDKVQETQERERNRTVKRWNGNEFSDDELATANFLSSVQLALRYVQKTHLNSKGTPWHYEDVEASGGFLGRLLYNGEVVAKQRREEQAQGVETEDGVVHGQETKSRLVWEFEPAFLEYLKATPDWEFVFGSDFMTTLRGEFQQMV